MYNQIPRGGVLFRVSLPLQSSLKGYTCSTLEQLKASHIYLFRAGAALLNGVSLSLKKGHRIGLVGANGVGKSSLLDILAGDAAPSDGRIVRSPGTQLSYLKQSMNIEFDGTLLAFAQTALEPLRNTEKQLRSEEALLAQDRGDLNHYATLQERFEALGGYGAEARLEKGLLEFGLSQAQFDQPFSSLSGGERARAQLASALSTSPDVLLLDEPSNHLDIQLRRVLQERLKAYRGALLFASHDRALLDAVCTHVAFLKDGSLTLHRGNYSALRLRQGHARERSAKEAKEVAKRRERILATQARLKKWGTAKAQRQRKSLEKRLPDEVAEVVEKTVELRLESPKSKGRLLSAKHLSYSVGDKAILTDQSIYLDAGDKVALLGENGSGKTTLLNLLAGEAESQHPKTEFYFSNNAKLAYADQLRRGVREDATALAQVTAYVSEQRAQLLLALVGIKRSDWASYPDTLSGGERARLGVALLIAAEKNVLLLDEPTNDLDVNLIETLQSALQTSDAAVLFATHDEALVKALATRVIALENGELIEYRGGVEGYFKGTRRLEPQLEPTEPEVHPVQEGDTETLERLELERLELEASFENPFVGERDRVRDKQRYEWLITELMQAYDAGLPAPAPSYGASYKGVTLTTDGFVDDVARIHTNGLFGLELRRTGTVTHVRLLESEDACSLIWARCYALSALQRIAFEHLNLSALQIQSSDNLEGSGFKAAGQGWWVVTLSDYEQRLGYPAEVQAVTEPKKRRRKRRKKRNRIQSPDKAT